ncbi:T-complex protein 1 subunit beta [Cichlidogyrus casuarinus]|uniref:T-complex protein 1 subunit beta n=1 Tax=Cichlidogyrus casuarinus TaxID=1844966 RepID=A0ABD2QL57_9PLAT
MKNNSLSRVWLLRSMVSLIVVPINIIQLSLQPIQVLSQGADEERAENARISSFVGAIAIGDMIKSTLGPKGMDKILINEGDTVQVTNDGATILRSVSVENPAAKVLIEMSKVQDDEVGDGTTSVTVLASQLLKEAEKLVGLKIHPQTICQAYRKASDVSLKALEDAANSYKVDMKVKEVPAEFRNQLTNIAMTTLSSKLLTQHKEHFAKLAVDAILRLKGSGNLQAIQVILKLGGTLSDSYLDEGFLLDKTIGVNQPKKMENCKILIANTPMDTDKIKVFGSKIKVDAISKVAELELAEKEKMKDKVNKILKHNCNVFINRQLIYNYPEQLFTDAGVMAIEHADFEGVERLALVTGGEIVSTFDSPEATKLGTCDVIEEVTIGEDRLIRFGGVALGEACTIVLRGATKSILAEAERSLHDALCVLSETVKDPRVVCGGGACEMLMADAVMQEAQKMPNKMAVGMEAFARSLTELPTVIAENGGFDSIDLINQLKAKHREGNNFMGLDMVNGEIADMRKLGIMEAFKSKRQIVISASEAADMILRVDDIIRAAPRRRTDQAQCC